MHFLLVCKPSSRKVLYEWVDYLEKTKHVKTVIKKRWTGKRREIETYRYAHQLPIRDGEDALKVNGCELTATREDGMVVYHNTFITDHDIDDKTVLEVVKAGRTRWKIENENNNTFKTKGYHFEHNF